MASPPRTKGEDMPDEKQTTGAQKAKKLAASVSRIRPRKSGFGGDTGDTKKARFGANRRELVKL